MARLVCEQQERAIDRAMNPGQSDRVPTIRLDFSKCVLTRQGR